MDKTLDQDLPEEAAARREKLLKTALELLRIKAAREKQWDVHNFDLLHHEWVGSFEDAIKSADLLLRQIEERDVDIHAYQVFEKGRKYTAEEISKKFGELKWPLLTSKNTVRTDLNTIEEAMKTELDNIKAQVLSGEEKAFSEAMESFSEHIEAICRQDALSETYPALRDKLNEVRMEVRMAHAPAHHSETEPTYHRRKSFIDWCFVREKIESKPGETRQEVRRYRAFDIFLYAARSKVLEDKLTTSWSNLAESFVPYPSLDIDYAFREALENAPPTE